MDPAWISAATALAAAIIGCTIWCLRWAWKILKRTTTFLDDFFGEAAREGVPARPGVMARLGSVEALVTQVAAETRPNSGGSLRDIVVKTASDVTEIKAEQALMRARMEQLEKQRAGRERHQP